MGLAKDHKLQLNFEAEELLVHSDSTVILLNCFVLACKPKMFLCLDFSKLLKPGIPCGKFWETGFQAELWVLCKEAFAATESL